MKINQCASILVTALQLLPIASLVLGFNEGHYPTLAAFPCPKVF